MEMKTVAEAPFTGQSVEAVLLDADLFVKYKHPERAVALLNQAIHRSPRSISLREKLRDVFVSLKQPTEASKQCLALANLYINREDFEKAYDRLQEAKLMDPRVSVAPGLEAIRRARRPEFEVNRSHAPVEVRKDCAMAGNLSLVSIFDAIQMIENSQLTGLLILKSDKVDGSIAFNEGKIVDAEAQGHNGKTAFRHVLEINSGTFEFNTSADEFPIVLNVGANTNFLLDLLAEMDTEKMLREINNEEDMALARLEM
jgi:tetratricopeptide (TPR) repeat protein